MNNEIVQKAPKDRLRVLIFSWRTHECMEFYDFGLAQEESIDNLISLFGNSCSFFDSPKIAGLYAICVNEKGECIRALPVVADKGKFAVVVESFWGYDVLKNYDGFQAAVDAAKSIVMMKTHVSLDLATWNVIDDRGLTVWSGTNDYHRVNLEAQA